MFATLKGANPDLHHIGTKAEGTEELVYVPPDYLNMDFFHHCLYEHHRYQHSENRAEGTQGHSVDLLFRTASFIETQQNLPSTRDSQDVLPGGNLPSALRTLGHQTQLHAMRSRPASGGTYKGLREQPDRRDSNHLHEMPRMHSEKHSERGTITLETIRKHQRRST